MDNKNGLSGRKHTNMILADKIINERKKNGWSQEDLADKLGVSRQSISKWEGALAVPDLQRILDMAELFGVSTDYLLKDDEPKSEPDSDREIYRVDREAAPGRVRVSLEEVNEYLDFVKSSINTVANAVSLCIISPALLIILAGVSERPDSIVSEGMAALIGVVVLLGIVAVAVMMFIIYGNKANQYKKFGSELLETEYGVDGLVKERRSELAQYYNLFICIGVALCILSPIGVIATGCLEASDSLICIMVAGMLVVIAVAVNLFVRAGMVKEGLDKVCNVEDYDYEHIMQSKEKHPITSCYWTIVVAAYLFVSFRYDCWDRSWLIFVIAGVLTPVVHAIERGLQRRSANKE